MCKRKFGGNLCFAKQFFRNIFGPIAKFFHHGCQNCLQYVPKNIERYNISGSFLIVYKYSVLSEKRKSFRQRKFCRLTKPPFTCSVDQFENFLRKITVSGKSSERRVQKNWDALQKFFRHMLKMQLACPEEIWEENFFFEILDVSSMTQTTRRKVSKCLSKLRFTCAEKFLEENFSRRKIIFLWIISRTSREKLSTGLSELPSKVLLQLCEKNKFLVESQFFYKYFRTLK